MSALTEAMFETKQALERSPHRHHFWWWCPYDREEAGSYVCCCGTEVTGGVDNQVEVLGAGPHRRDEELDFIMDGDPYDYRVIERATGRTFFRCGDNFEEGVSWCAQWNREGYEPIWGLNAWTEGGKIMVGWDNPDMRILATE